MFRLTLPISLYLQQYYIIITVLQYYIVLHRGPLDLRSDFFSTTTTSIV